MKCLCSNVPHGTLCTQYYQTCLSVNGYPEAPATDCIPLLALPDNTQFSRPGNTKTALAERVLYFFSSLFGDDGFQVGVAATNNPFWIIASRKSTGQRS